MGEAPESFHLPLYISLVRESTLLLFSPDGERLIVGAYDIEIWDIATVELVGELLTSSPVTSLALHPDETQLAVGTEEGQIEFWSLQTSNQTALIDGNDMEVEGIPSDRYRSDSLTFSPDGRTPNCWIQRLRYRCLGCGESRVDAILGLQRRDQMRSSKVGKQQPQDSLHPVSTHGGALYLTLSHDGKTVVALADRSANVGCWEVDTGKLIGRFEGYGYPVELGFSDDGRYFVTGWAVPRVWDTATTEIIAEMQYDNKTNAAAHSPDGKYVAISHRDRRITVWDVDTATVKHVLRGAFME